MLCELLNLFLKLTMSQKHFFPQLTVIFPMVNPVQIYPNLLITFGPKIQQATSALKPATHYECTCAYSYRSFVRSYVYYTALSSCL